MVKWISQRSSEPSFQVRILVEAQIKWLHFFGLPQEVTFVTSVRIRWAQRYEATKPNRERRAASLFYDGKIRLVAETPGGMRYSCNETPLS